MDNKIKSFISQRATSILVGTILSIATLLAVQAISINMSAANDHTVEAQLTTPEELANGRIIYGANCASCHGENLEGEQNWRSIKPDGTMPAPPHDKSGHTWHHDDQLLFAYTKEGGQSVIGGSFKSGMPGFGETLTDEEI
ncbi:MAG: cytochrome c [Sneathiella sp.]|uniref:cytochrome c n=1 Tax=Sneathiella sp. TaxID=1964365 RepID=UPI003001C588